MKFHLRWSSHLRIPSGRIVTLDHQLAGKKNNRCYSQYQVAKASNNSCYIGQSLPSVRFNGSMSRSKNGQPYFYLCAGMPRRAHIYMTCKQNTYSKTAWLWIYFSIYAPTVWGDVTSCQVDFEASKEFETIKIQTCTGRPFTWESPVHSTSRFWFAYHLTPRRQNGKIYPWGQLVLNYTP